MAQSRNFICDLVQAGQTCSYGCTAQRTMCHAFFDGKCSVLEARYCENGWHEHIEHDTKAQYQANKSSTKDLNNEREKIRLRSRVPPRKPLKRSRSEDSPRARAEDTDTDTETLTNISLCELELYDTPEPEALVSAYKKQMRKTQGNALAKDIKTKAFKFAYAQLMRKKRHSGVRK